MATQIGQIMHAMQQDFDEKVCFQDCSKQLTVHVEREIEYRQLTAILPVFLG